MEIQYRKVQVGEEEVLYACMKQLDQETPYMLYLPHERTFNKEKMRSMIVETNQNGVVLAAYVNEKIAGYLSVSVTDLEKIRHSGYLVLGVLAEYGHQGIGASLLTKGIEWAMEQQLHRLELTVLVDNKRAAALYERFGFEKEGIKKDSIYMDGSYHDEFYMGRIQA